MRTTANKTEEITVKINGDTADLKASIEDTKKSVAGLGEEVSQVDKLLKLDPQNLILIRQKQDLFKQSVESTKNKIKEMDAAQSKMEQQFQKGEIDGGQYRSFQRELEKAKLDLKGLEGEAASVAKIGSAFSEIKTKVAGVGEKLAPVATGLQQIGNVSGSIMQKGTQALTGYAKAILKTGQTTVNAALELSAAQGTADATLGAGGIAIDDLAQKSANLAAQQGLVSTQMQGLSATVGSAFMPAFTGVLSMVTAGLPSITESIGAVFSGQEGSTESLTQGLVTMITGVIASLAENLPPLLEGFNTVIISLISAVSQTLPLLITTVLPALMDGLINLILGIVQQLPILLPVLVEGAMALFLGFLDGLNLIIPQLTGMMPTIIGRLMEVLVQNLPAIISGGIQLLMSLINGIVNSIPQLIAAFISLITIILGAIVANLPTIITAGIQILMSLIQGIVSAIPQIIDTLVSLFPVLVQTFMDNLPQIIEAGIQILIALAGGLIQAIPDLLFRLPEIITAIVNGLGDGAQRMGDVGLDLIRGLWDGIKGAAQWLWDKITGFCQELLGGIMGFFGIHSPSTKFRDGIGKNLAEGIGVGFTEQMGKVRRDMQRAIPSGFSTAIDVNGHSNISGQAMPDGSLLGGFVQNNYYTSPKALSASELARKTRINTRQLILQGAR